MNIAQLLDSDHIRWLDGCLCLCSDLAVSILALSLRFSASFLASFEHTVVVVVVMALLISFAVWLPFGLVFHFHGRGRYTFATCNVTHRMRNNASGQHCYLHLSYTCACAIGPSALVLYFISESRVQQHEKKAMNTCSMQAIWNVLPGYTMHTRTHTFGLLRNWWPPTNKANEFCAPIHTIFAVAHARTQKRQDGCSNKQIYSSIIWLLLPSITLGPRSITAIYALVSAQLNTQNVLAVVIDNRPHRYFIPLLVLRLAGNRMN